MKWNGEPSQDHCGLRVAGRGREISWELVVTVQMRDVMVWICDGRRGVVRKGDSRHIV